MDVRGCYDKNNVVPEALRLINQAQWIAPHAFDFSRGLVDLFHLHIRVRWNPVYTIIL